VSYLFFSGLWLGLKEGNNSLSLCKCYFKRFKSKRKFQLHTLTLLKRLTYLHVDTSAKQPSNQINYNNYGWRENVREGVGEGIVKRMVLAGVRR